MKDFLNKNVKVALAIVLWIAVGVVGTLGLGALTSTDAEARSFKSSSKSSMSRSYSKPKASLPRSYPKPASKAQPRNTMNYNQTKVVKQTTIINRGGGNAYGGGYGGGSGVGMGGAILGGAAAGVGGAMLYDALTNDEGLTQEQVDAKVQEALKQQEAEQQAQQLQQQIEALQLQQQQLLGTPAVKAADAILPSGQ